MSKLIRPHDTSFLLFQHFRVKAGSESSFAALVHASVTIFRALPNSRPLILRHGIAGMITHCVPNCTLTSALRSGKDALESPMVWPRWLAPCTSFVGGDGAAHVGHSG